MGQDGAEVHFKIKKTTTMKKLKEAYCGKKVSVELLRFDSAIFVADDGCACKGPERSICTLEFRWSNHSRHRYSYKLGHGGQ
jgi:hypothetical protein